MFFKRKKEAQVFVPRVLSWNVALENGLVSIFPPK